MHLIHLLFWRLKKILYITVCFYIKCVFLCGVLVLITRDLIGKGKGIASQLHNGMHSPEMCLLRLTQPLLIRDMTCVFDVCLKGCVTANTTQLGSVVRGVKTVTMETPLWGVPATASPAPALEDPLVLLCPRPRKLSAPTVLLEPQVIINDLLYTFFIHKILKYTVKNINNFSKLCVVFTYFLI